jgi:hypothetical protein
MASSMLTDIRLAVFFLDLNKENDDGQFLKLRAGFSVTLSTEPGPVNALENQSEALAVI